MDQITTDITSDLRAQFDHMRAAHLADPFPQYHLRKDRLRRLEATLLENAKALEEAMVADFGGRDRVESALYDVTMTVGDVRRNRRNLRQWMRVKRVRMARHVFPSRGRIIAQPKGVVGIMAPWNFPVYLTAAPLAAALAAGNRVMLKPSEITARTSQVLADSIARNFDDTEISTHLGGAHLAAEFANLPFGHLFFTGSTRVGKMVAAAAARNLTPVTLELGGKSPAILGEHADVKRAAERILMGKLANAGQICVAPDYVMMPRAHVEPFIAAMHEAMAKILAKRNPIGYSTIATEAHLKRLQTIVDQARDLGVRVVEIGPFEDSPRKEPVAVLVDPPEECRAMQEELFGPLLPIKPYDSADEVRAYLATRPEPLGIYVFTENAQEADHWLRHTLSGGACVNETVMQVAADTMPFGGVGQSGMGAYHGRAGFETFSHMKSVFYQRRINGMWLLQPGGPRKFSNRVLRRFI